MYMHIKLFSYYFLDANISYDDHDRDQMMALDSLAAYYVGKAKKERDKEAKKEYFSKVSFNCFTKLWMILRKKFILIEFVTAS